MGRAVRFVVVPLVGRGVVTTAGYPALVGTTRSWFAEDLTLRSRLAVTSASRGLARNRAPERRA